jgi:hypothetical protein
MQAYERLLPVQNGRCAICGMQETDKRKLFVDHCHHSGEVRGLLCSTCNTGIGMLRDDANLAARALEYLKNGPGSRP